jgi:hypothetical protein
MPDDQTIVEGDAGFLGMASRLNPLQLQAGMVQYCENMRLDRGVAQTRKGAKRLGDEISSGAQPLTLPFVLDANAIIRASYSGGILASGVFSSPNYFDSNEYIVLCGPTSAFLYRQDVSSIEEVSFTAPGSASEEILEQTDQATCIQAFNRFYLLREADTSLPGWGWKSTASSGILVSGTTATVHCTGHGYSAGMRVRIEEGDSAAFAGHEFDVANPVTSNSFSIIVPTGTPSIPYAAIRRVKPPLWWDGSKTHFQKAEAGIPEEGASYKRMRSTGWASYIGNRLWLPDGRDTVAISDVLDPDLYDPFFQSFRANQGSNDYLVAIHPWVEGQALIFMRNSIWLANLADASNATGNEFTVDAAVSRVTLLTDEIGCVARKTIVTAGQFVFFLSDSGVYRLDIQLDLKLRANTQPLSDTISDQLEEINKAQAHKATAKWWANRYYLAVPIGDSAINNNSIFIWNALNQQWESKDLYSVALDELIVADYNSQRRLHTAARSGTLFLLDELEYGDEVPYANAEGQYTPVPGLLTSRSYSFGSLNSKRLTRSKASVVLPPGAACKLRAYTTDYDAEFQIAALSNTTEEDEDYTLKAALRCKAVALDLEFLTTSGRPTLRQITAEATRSAFDPSLTRTLN